ncbi:MAG: hypothetical protein AAFO58_02810 [Pseudomonadota bacterium]
MRAPLTAGLSQAMLALAATTLVFVLATQAGVSLWLGLWSWLTVGFATAPLLFMVRTTISRDPAPELRKRGYVLRGDGCLMCLHVRGWLPCALAPLGAALTILSGSPIPAVVGTCLTVAHLLRGLADLRADRSPYWTRAAGFTMVTD